jgi:hypothetical protein
VVSVVLQSSFPSWSIWRLVCSFSIFSVTLSDWRRATCIGICFHAWDCLSLCSILSMPCIWYMSQCTSITFRLPSLLGAAQKYKTICWVFAPERNMFSLQWINFWWHLQKYLALCTRHNFRWPITLSHCVYHCPVANLTSLHIIYLTENYYISY